VLNQADRQKAHQASTIAGGVLSTVRAVANAVTASAPPLTSPDQRRPTDLTLLMAKAMAHTLSVMGESTKRSAAAIYTAQDAADYLSEAASLVRQRGGA
jgi:hypothetical protein